MTDNEALIADLDN